MLYHRSFTSYKELLIHQHSCKKKKETTDTVETDNTITNQTAISANTNNPPIPGNVYSSYTFKWNQVDGKMFSEHLNLIYDTIVYWKKNVVLLPTGAAGKNYIREVTRLIHAWFNDTQLKDVALKVVHVIPVLLLQKPSKKSKAKDHVKHLEKRLALWQEGNFWIY